MHADAYCGFDVKKRAGFPQSVLLKKTLGIGQILVRGDELALCAIAMRPCTYTCVCQDRRNKKELVDARVLFDIVT